jgi:putative flippase GtrA
MVGGLNTVFGIALYTSFYLLLKDFYSPVLILLFTQFFAVLFSHFTQRKFVWHSSSNYTRELIKFSQAYTFLVVINIILLHLATEVWKFSALISQYLIGVSLIALNYIFQKQFIFKK